MADQVPSLGVAATADTITITLPTSSDTSLPRIPEELRGAEVPSFVAEWILESDEIGVLIQELLQAPTASLCRIFRVPTNAVTTDQIGTPDLGGFSFGAPQVSRPVFRPPSPQFGAEVSGFGVGTAEVIEELPAGVQLPSRLRDLCEIARRVDNWIEKGYRVRDWAEEQGHGDASWLPGTA